MAELDEKKPHPLTGWYITPFFFAFPPQPEKGIRRVKLFIQEDGTMRVADLDEKVEQR